MNDSIKNFNFDDDLEDEGKEEKDIKMLKERCEETACKFSDLVRDLTDKIEKIRKKSKGKGKKNYA